jgi:hypothetical protein
MLLPGIIGALVVDSESGTVLEQAGVFPSDPAALADRNTELLRAKMRMMNALGVREAIGDIVITLDTQLHILRPLPGKNAAGLFIYVAMCRSNADLTPTRAQIDKLASKFAA